MDAIAFLTDEHEVVRELFRQLDAVLPTSPRLRRDLLDRLSEELYMHERIEDEVFYPAVTEVSEMVPEARGEHRQLAETLSVVQGLDPASDAFSEQLLALWHEVLRHLTAEEDLMFVEARALGSERLLALGQALEARKRALVASDVARAERRMKLIASKIA
jgi:hypothetical protein